jgi:hypothetical protein
MIKAMIELFFIFMSPFWPECATECRTAPFMVESAEQQPQAPGNYTPLTKFRWNPKVGMRIGVTSVEWRSRALAFLLENQLNRHLAMRPAVEFTVYEGSEYYWDDDWGHSRYRGTAKINHVGAVADCIFYFRGQRPIGRGIYLLAGLGVHRTKLKEVEAPYWAESQIVMALSYGIGWTWKYIGYEMKYTRSTFDSIYYQDVGKEWFQLLLNFRFNASGWLK